MFLNDLPDSLKAQILKVCDDVPEAYQIFEALYSYTTNHGNKRKHAKTQQEYSHIREIDENHRILELKDISMLSPMRKKLDMTFFLSLSTNKPILSFNKNNIPELIIQNLDTNILFATFLPFPEKDSLIYLFITYASVSETSPDPILITMNKENILKQFRANRFISDDCNEFIQCVEYIKKQAIITGFKISDFFSIVQESVPFYVGCHRGTKEGTLYFLPGHILFGFKKPILCFESQDIESITYSSITRMTFNITLITNSNVKYEFSMIDQGEFYRIDEYVKAKQMTDKSMTDEFKAKPMSKTQQQSTENISVLEEATKQLEKNTNVNNEEDSESEDDQNFEGETDLSDGSGIESCTEDSTHNSTGDTHNEKEEALYHTIDIDIDDNSEDNSGVECY